MTDHITHTADAVTLAAYNNRYWCTLAELLSALEEAVGWFDVDAASPQPSRCFIRGQLGMLSHEIDIPTQDLWYLLDVVLANSTIDMREDFLKCVAIRVKSIATRYVETQSAELLDCSE